MAVLHIEKVTKVYYKGDEEVCAPGQAGTFRAAASASSITWKATELVQFSGTVVWDMTDSAGTGTLML